MKFICLDVGTKRIGVASCDALEIAASPLSVIPADKKAPSTVAGLIEREFASGVVVGLPLSTDGTERESCKMVRDFIAKLKPLLKVPIETFDERFTTKIAEASLIEAGMRREKRRDIRDAVSASLILQSFLDLRRNTRNKAEPTQQE